MADFLARAQRRALLPSRLRAAQRRPLKPRVQSPSSDPPSLRTLARTSGGAPTAMERRDPAPSEPIELPARPSDVFEAALGSAPPPPEAQPAEEPRPSGSEMPVVLEQSAAPAPPASRSWSTVLTSCAFGVGLVLAAHSWLTSAGSASPPDQTRTELPPQVDVRAFIGNAARTAPTAAESARALRAAAPELHEAAGEPPEANAEGPSKSVAPAARSAAPGWAGRPLALPQREAKPAEQEHEPEAAATAPFDPAAARQAIAAAALQAAGCGNGVSGRAQVAVTIAPSGRATQALLLNAPELLGTPAGSCIARALQNVVVPPFEGPPITVTKTIRIP